MSWAELCVELVKIRWHSTLSGLFWLSLTCIPRISFGAIYIQPFQGCFDYRSHGYPEFHSVLFTFNPFRVVLIIAHMFTPNFIRCYLHSTLSGLFWLSFTCIPRISFGVIYIQPFQDCLIIAHMHTPNFIRCYLHSTLSGLFDCRSHAYPEFYLVLFTFNPFRVVESTFVHGN
jgi:hypothetical protein